MPPDYVLLQTLGLDGSDLNSEGLGIPISGVRDTGSRLGVKGLLLRFTGSFQGKGLGFRV